LFILAETWFAILFTVIVEIVPCDIRSMCVGVFLFIMDSIGGNLAILVELLKNVTNYRTALYVFFAGSVGASK
jgi:hypothetical protein